MSAYAVYQEGYDEGFTDGKLNNPRTPELLADEMNMSEEAKSTFCSGYYEGVQVANQESRRNMQEEVSRAGTYSYDR